MTTNIVEIRVTAETPQEIERAEANLREFYSIVRLSPLYPNLPNKKGEVREGYHRFIQLMEADAQG